MITLKIQQSGGSKSLSDGCSVQNETPASHTGGQGSNLRSLVFCDQRREIIEKYQNIGNFTGMKFRDLSTDFSVHTPGFHQFREICNVGWFLVRLNFRHNDISCDEVEEVDYFDDVPP